MEYGRIAGLEKRISRLVIGADANNTMEYTDRIFSEYVKCGGNAFDTSYAYGDPVGSCERNLGAWIEARGIRDEVVVIEKGGNPPKGTPEGIIEECRGGLERLGMDRVDIWLMHRDNPEAPVAGLVDAMNELKERGWCTIFGVSNWSLERLEEAKDYCDASGKQFFSLLSDQFSLAEPLDDFWPPLLCLPCRDDAFRKWLQDEQLPLVPWSSQARGFFTDMAGRDKLDNKELVRLFYSDENFARRDRAIELAEKRGVDPVCVALAWVLQQPFPTFPIIGPREPWHLHSSLKALEVELTAEELDWLDGASRRAGSSPSDSDDHIPSPGPRI